MASISSSARIISSAPSRSWVSRISVARGIDSVTRAASFGDPVTQVVELVVERPAQLADAVRVSDVLVRNRCLAHPNLPVTYISVRSSEGLEKIFVVKSNSIRRPVRRSLSGLTSVVKNAVRSLTRAACCMLWVTMTIV